jgi:hypothetical protein
MAEDTLLLTIRLYDPKEKTDAKMAASWVPVQVDRSDLGMSQADFVAKYVAPALAQLAQLKLT